MGIGSMNASTPVPPKPKWSARKVLLAFGLFLILAIGVYFLYVTIDGAALSTQQGKARVLAKARVLLDDYHLKLAIDGEETFAPVAEEIYEAVQVGAEVQVSYQQRRISRRINVVQVNR